jgi:hypothetical protein
MCIKIIVTLLLFWRQTHWLKNASVMRGNIDIHCDDLTVKILEMVSIDSIRETLRLNIMFLLLVWMPFENTKVPLKKEYSA